MTSQVDVCNIVISRLGGNTITSLDDGTTESNLCATFFDALADRAMVQGSWTTTIFRRELPRISPAPAFGFLYAYQLPVDPKCLKVLNIDETTPGNTPYKVEGKRLLTDAETVKIRYVGRLSDVEDYGPLLTEAFESLLGSYLALPVAGKGKLAKELKAEYEAHLQRNQAVDGQQGSKDTMVSPTLTEVRF